MQTGVDSKQAERERRSRDVDLLVFLASAEPREGWEFIFEPARQRIVEEVFGLTTSDEKPGDG